MPLHLQPTEADVLCFHEVIEALLGTFLADAGLLEASEGGLTGGGQRLVDPDQAVVEGHRNSP